LIWACTDEDALAVIGSADVVGVAEVGVVGAVVVVVVVVGVVVGEVVDEPLPWAAPADPGAASSPSIVDKHKAAAPSLRYDLAVDSRLSVTDVTRNTLRSLPGAAQWPWRS
jgi:hypothetical protein